MDSKKAEDISFSSLPYGKDTTTRIHYKSYDPRPPLMRKTTQLDLDEFLEQLESLPVTCGFVHLLKQPASFDAPRLSALLPLIPHSIQAHLRHKILQEPLPPTLQNVKNFGMEFIAGITPITGEKKRIKEKTHLQPLSARWHKEYHCRLITSNFGRVALHWSGVEKLAETILFTKVPAHVPAIQWSRDHESTAFREYQKLLPDFYPDLKLQKVDFMEGDPAYLGASPDGIFLDDTDALKGIIEIKCPYSAANITVHETCMMLNDFYCLIDDSENLRLHSDHSYYY